MIFAPVVVTKTGMIVNMETMDWIQFIASWIIPGALALAGAYWGVRLAIANLQNQVRSLEKSLVDFEEDLDRFEVRVDQNKELITDHEKRLIRIETVHELEAKENNPNGIE
jgi:hypothetical protein